MLNLLFKIVKNYDFNSIMIEIDILSCGTSFINMKTIDIVMVMDEFARTIYEEYKQAKNNLSK